jgi:CheY-like chemotaxis protein
VDDNRDIADSTSMLLAMRGYAVETAYDGNSALATMEETRADTVLLDISMPGMDGYEVARRIRAMPYGRRVNLIAVTGQGNPEDQAMAVRAGIDRHMVKPLDWDALDDVMATMPVRRSR